MRTILRKAVRDESGKILILVLVLLVVGGLLLGPLLGLMSTGLMAGQTYERKAAELYAADAGVEEAIWRIQNPGNLVWVNDKSEAGPVTVNENIVEVQIERRDLGISACRTRRQYEYYVVSEASADGSATTVNAVLSVDYSLPLDFSGLLDYAIASNEQIALSGGGAAAPEIYGDVYIWDREGFSGNEDWIKDPYELYDRHQRSVTWPTYEELSAYYWEDVKRLSPNPDDEIDVTDARVRQSSLWTPSSGKLTIKGNGSIDISGTVYVKGNLHFNGTPKISVVLGEEAVLFVEGSITMDPSTPTDDRLSISGSGCIIARNNIDLKPMVSSSEDDDYVLVLSLEGNVTLLPMGTFQGTVASTSGVTVQPRNVLRWISPEGKNLNFPMGDGEGGEQDVDKLPISDLSIVSWQIQSGGQ